MSIRTSTSTILILKLWEKAPLPNITTLQTDITLPSTIPLVLDALGGRKADLVVCDGAPDGTSLLLPFFFPSSFAAISNRVCSHRRPRSRRLPPFPTRPRRAHALANTHGTRRHPCVQNLSLTARSPRTLSRFPADMFLLQPVAARRRRRCVWAV